MFPFHVSVDQTRDWLDYAQFAATIVAALGTMIVATLIARSQNRLQKLQLEQQAHQLTKDLFDRRFAIFAAVEDFIVWVVRSEGKTHFIGTVEYGNWWDAIQKARMLFDKEVFEYMTVVEKAAGAYHVAVTRMAKNSADMQAIEDENRLLNQLTITLREQRFEVFRPYLALFQKAVARA